MYVECDGVAVSNQFITKFKYRPPPVKKEMYYWFLSSHRKENGLYVKETQFRMF